MQEITTKVYNFDELSSDVQDKIVEKAASDWDEISFRQQCEFDWFDSTLQGFADCLGLEYDIQSNNWRNRPSISFKTKQEYTENYDNYNEVFMNFGFARSFGIIQNALEYANYRKKTYFMKPVIVGVKSRKSRIIKRGLGSGHCIFSGSSSDCYIDDAWKTIIASPIKSQFNMFDILRCISDTLADAIEKIMDEIQTMAYWRSEYENGYAEDVRYTIDGKIFSH